MAPLVSQSPLVLLLLLSLIASKIVGYRCKLSKSVTIKSVARYESGWQTARLQAVRDVNAPRPSKLIYAETASPLQSVEAVVVIPA